MIDLIRLEKEFLLPHVRPGCVAVDFTMGNGHDTLWLSNAVGSAGKVYAFDVQPEALEHTCALLEKENASPNYTLILDSHDRFAEYVPGGFDAGLFNLGYLPGGDRKFTTKRETTLPAVRSAIAGLHDDGGIVLAVYPGHPEGRAEANLIEDELSRYDRSRICMSRFEIVNSPTSPLFFVIEKR